MNTPMEQFGENAGKVWQALHSHGPLSETKLINFTFLNDYQLYTAIGWLARENKICKNGTIYKLGNTNLTNKIGSDAGKVWNVLQTQKEADVQWIAKCANLDVNDAYSALGWLARENKIDTKHVLKQRKQVMAFWLK